MRGTSGDEKQRDGDLDQCIRALTHWVPSHEVDAQDVFIVGYMKSGTNWFRNLVAGAIHGLLSEHTPYSVVWELVPNHGPSKLYYKRYGTPMYFRSHAFPRPDHRRVVYLLRDGRDVIVSLAHHLRAVTQQDVDLLQLARGRSPRFRGKYEWHRHVEAWMDNPYQADILTVKYEDLMTDAPAVLRRFCQWAGVRRDSGYLERVAASTTFGKMREKEVRFGFGRQQWPKDRSFVRRGVVGSHRDEMSTEIMEAFLRSAADTLRKVGYL
jgi:hypothetical protein